MLDQSETSDKLKIKVLNVSKKELLRDLQRAPEFDQSALFKKVYEEEFGVFGGAPFAALIGDYEFGTRSGGYRTAGEGGAGGRRGARAVPHRGRAGDVQHGQLHQSRRAARYGEDLRHHRIRQVEELPAERGFALRRAVPAAHPDAPALRQGRHTVEAFNYEEGVDGTDHSKYLWGNAAYALGARLTNAFADVRLVRGDSRRGGRRPGGRPADAQLHYR